MKQLKFYLLLDKSLTYLSDCRSIDIFGNIKWVSRKRYYKVYM